MTSLVQGFEYDIFISYRHKDNRAEKWVSQFVQALREELEGTFKESVSIYFDENPYDGLLENHSVDQSLNNKLKSLILIPIVSQTYSDPRCYAWQQEFCAFNKIALQDTIGRDIRLGNGNVASRILPVTIHEITREDIDQIEDELQAKFRFIDFTYRAPGVNRPLRQDDKREDNIGRLAYRDQMNKVANALKEIIQGIQSMLEYPLEMKTVRTEKVTALPMKKRKKSTRSPSLYCHLSVWPRMLLRNTLLME
jgi:hypothetical protein